MLSKFQFDSDTLHSVAGGRSAIEIPVLHIRTTGEADSFIASYGFDLQQSDAQDKLWYYHRRAMVLLTERLGYPESQIPEVLRDRKSLQDLRNLLLFASDGSPENKTLQRWSCAILRCMHVYVHAESDLFSSFAHEIQAQVLGPLQESIVYDGSTNLPILKGIDAQVDPIHLKGFEIKPFKTSTSTVIKLLARPDALAMKVFDKLGVRFVTKNLFDSFQVIRFLVAESLISFPHIMPDQSSNTLYPVDLFLSICEEMLRRVGPPPGEDEILSIFETRLKEAGEDAQFLRKPNEQSASNFQFIKFITRKLVQVEMPGKGSFNFFYPFEVQIMDEKAYEAMQTGPLVHEAYKERQREAARHRLFPEGAPE